MRAALGVLGAVLLADHAKGFSPFALGLRLGGKHASLAAFPQGGRSAVPPPAAPRGARSGLCMTEKTKLTGPGLVLGPNEESDWFDSKCFGRPVVNRYIGEEGEENWRMWYSGRDDAFDGKAIDISTGRTGLCESSDGISWTRVRGDDPLGSVMGFNEEEWWSYDTVHTCPGDVTIVSTDKVRGAKQSGYGVNFMYLFGGDAEEVDMGGETFGGKEVPEGTLIKGLRMRIGLALSYDGVHWTRMEGDHHSGAVFDVGEEGEWDSLMTAWPQVVQHTAGDLRMYYTSYDRAAKKWCVGLARSNDGFKWEKKGRIISGGGEGAFDEFGISRTWTVMHPQTKVYHMFCEGSNPKGHSIGLYTSKDGFTWECASPEPIFSGSTDSEAWDAKGVAFPCVVPLEDGTCRMYYSCNKDGASGIGMAVSDGADWTKFVRHGQ